MIKKQIEYGNVISYVPTQEIIQIPYACESNIWNTKKNINSSYPKRVLFWRLKTAHPLLLYCSNTDHFEYWYDILKECIHPFNFHFGHFKNNYFNTENN